MRAVFKFLKMTLLGGLVIVLPAYISVLLVLKALGAVVVVVAPISAQLPDAAPYRNVLAGAVLLGACFAAGLAVRTALGRFVKRVVERNLLERVPGYAVFRGLTEKFAEVRSGGQFGSALAEIEEALVPAFIVERHADGHFTVFVPSAPTPAMGAIFILPAARVHELDVPLVTVAACVSKWGAGCGELRSKMLAGRPGGRALEAPAVRAATAEGRIER